ncbi:alpha/beta hydrolase family protein [Rhodobacter viridis]|uniref:Alpha/beta hydrolase family protein n=1 Tax=Rhodobacter viridis TaxID=1054202 RepID=A0A318TSD1_9RHOB|nr:alpha/beta hydrolase [Rhodobacter viridis]PYF07762.1 alpha/beta hydrolase family protein [Rhodobacter viridis]
MTPLFRAALLVPLLTACAAPAPEVTRAAGPTVIFEAGLGDTASVWSGVDTPPGLGRFAWTRAGYGFGADLVAGQSWPGDADGRRTGAEVTAQLGQALAKAQAGPPYILVGHSIGALYVLDFARTHPEAVKGIVLVDPRLPGFTARCKAAHLHGCEIPPLLRLTLSEVERIELDGVPETEAALRDLGALRDIPLTILLAEKAGLGEDPRWRAVWADHARAFAAGFSHARLIPVASGHYIQTTAPDQVSAAIRAVSRQDRRAESAE